MEFTKEFIEANGLEETQVEALNNYVQTEIVPTIKKEYDGLANKNAEGILDGAAKYAKTTLGIDLEREQGEKVGDYLKRAFDSKFQSKQSELEKKEQEYQEKLQNFKGGEQYQEELAKLKEDKDKLLKQVAELEPLKGFDEKYNTATQEMSKLKREVAYSNVKPNFPETVNKFEADAKWNTFKNGIEEKYNIELVDGKPIAIDKENEHKRYELATLVSQDESIAELLKGRQQKGSGASPVDMKEVDGLPFKIPSNVDSRELSNIVREYVLTKHSDITSNAYKELFSSLFIKAKQAQ